MSNFIYTMSMPPSVNQAYRVFGGRVIMSKIARDWYKIAIPHIMAQKNHETITKDIFLTVVLSPKNKRRQDIDNRNKCIFDALVKASVIEDDSQIKKLLIEYDCSKKDMVQCVIERLCE